MSKELFTKIYDKELFISGIISNPKDKSKVEYRKIEIKLIKIKLTNVYQVSFFTSTQVFHKNLSFNEVINLTLKFIDLYKQFNFYTKENDYLIFANRLNELAIKKSKPTKIKVEASNNRKKNYLLPENEFIPFLYELKVINKEGKVNPSMYFKFKQVNRYLEFVDDIIDKFKDQKVINIIDFGCGKSYLTFALHYFLSEIKKLNVNIIGLDLKKDVINNCNAIVEKYNLKNIQFLTGDIKDYDSSIDVDFVISLHACDVATDYALEKAIKWNSKVIFAVPCCQHEVNKMLKTDNLKTLEKYGIIKEKISSLITDASRAEILRSKGYDTQILEFIDIEETPKNLLIRAVYNGKKDEGALERLDALKSEFNYKLTLEKLLENE